MKHKALCTTAPSVGEPAIDTSTLQAINNRRLARRLGVSLHHAAVIAAQNGIGPEARQEIMGGRR
jgi:hypothetical protein